MDGERGTWRQGVAVVCALVLALLSSVALSARPAAAGEAVSAAFTPVRPCRLTDTRGAGTGFSRLDPWTIRVSVAGRCGIPMNATAATLTVTITEASSAGFATVYPTGVGRPLTTSGNVLAGETRATSTIARLGTLGSIDVFVSMGAQLVIDVTGGFVPANSSAAGRFVAMGPLRLADTRELGTRVLAGGALVMPLPGLSPDTSAVVVNVTITSTDGAGFATAFSNGDSVPPTATVTSDGPGQTRSATAIVPVSATGLKVFASVGTHIVVDLFGSFTGPSAAQGTAGLFTAIDPQRYLDTRSVSPLGVGVPLYPQGGLEMALPTNAAVPVFMIAAVDAAPGFLTTFPAGTARPGTASATIARPSETVANLAFAQKSTRGLSIFSYGTSHVVVDLVGWFSGVTRAATLGPPTNIAPPPPPAPTPAAPTPAPAPAPAPVTPPVAVPEPIEYLPLGSSGCNASIRVAVAKADAQTIGFSVEGRPIIAEHYGDPAGKPVLVVGPIHGDECSALAVVERVRALGRDGAVPPGLHLVVIPALNPDGLISGSRRNANGVDLNKDGGDWSQPETRALMDLTSTLQPRATIHLHSPLSMVGGQGGPFGLGTFMADHIAQRTGMHHSHSAGSSAPFLWLGQASILPSMAAVLVETPRGFPFEAMGATGEVKPGPPGSDALWQTTAEAIIESFSLV